MTFSDLAPLPRSTTDAARTMTVAEITRMIPEGLSEPPVLLPGPACPPSALTRWWEVVPSS